METEKNLNLFIIYVRDESKRGTKSRNFDDEKYMNAETE